MTAAVQDKKAETTKDEKKANPDGAGKSAAKAAGKDATVDVVPVPTKELEKLKAKAARFEEVEDLEEEVEEKKGTWLDLKDRAGRAKKNYEAAQEKLQQRIRDKTNLLFPPKDKAAEGAKKDETKPAAAKKPDAPAPVPADDNAWKSVTLADLGIDKPNVVARLFDEGITNFGQIEEWRAAKKKIAGLGDAAMQLIEDAIVAYWSKNPRKEAPKKDAANKVESATAATTGATTPTIIEIKPKGDFDSGKVFDVLDLGLSEGVVAAAAHPDLADTLRRGGTPDVGTLFRTPKGDRFVAAFNPTAPAAAGLFLLFRVFDKSSGKPSAKDPYYGAAVTFGDLTLHLGPLLDAVSVKDVAKKTTEKTA